jgi:hypothetical protein
MSDAWSGTRSALVLMRLRCDLRRRAIAGIASDMEQEMERVRKLVAEELTACADLKGRGITGDPAAYLVTPPRQEPFQSEFAATAGPSLVWLIADEAPGSPGGYLVVYDPSEDEFGLATKPRPGAVGSLVGWYGSLRETLEGM